MVVESPATIWKFPVGKHDGPVVVVVVVVVVSGVVVVIVAVVTVVVSGVVDVVVDVVVVSGVVVVDEVVDESVDRVADRVLDVVVDEVAIVVVDAVDDGDADSDAVVVLEKLAALVDRELCEAVLLEFHVLRVVLEKLCIREELGVPVARPVPRVGLSTVLGDVLVLLLLTLLTAVLVTGTLDCEVPYGHPGGFTDGLSPRVVGAA